MKRKSEEGMDIQTFDAALHRIYEAMDPETFPAEVIPLLMEITHSHCVGLCANALLPGDPHIAVAVAGRAERPSWQQYPQVSFEDHPSSRYAAAPAPPHAIRLSDHFPSRKALEATRYFREILQPRGLNHEMTLLLDTPSGQRLGLSVARSTSDYSDTEMKNLSLLGPHIRRAFHLAQTMARLKGEQDKAATWREVDLTARESEILRWAATGRTNADIADLLGVAPATVKTHLEHIFAKLGVKNRAAAVAALRDLPPPERA